MQTHRTAFNGLRWSPFDSAFRLGILIASFVITVAAPSANASQFIPNPPVYATGGTPLYMAVADVNRDGILDIVASNANGVVSVLLGKGKGVFEAPKTIVTMSGQKPPIAVADFNHDGFPDVAVMDAKTNSVWVYIGEGNGTFKAPGKFGTAASSLQMAVGDVNGDGHLDIVVSTTSGLSSLLGNGNGTFRTAINSPASEPGSLIALGDLNGDGRLDAVIAGGYQQDVVLLGAGNGTFNQFQEFQDCLASDARIALADLDGNGHLGLISTGYVESHGDFGYICDAPGNGDGTFTVSSYQSLDGSGSGIAIGDFNGDGRLDVAAANGAYLGIFLTAAGGPLTSQVDYLTAPVSAYAIVVGDFYRSGETDLAVGAEGGVQIFKNLGKGVFNAPPAIVVPPGQEPHTTAFVAPLDGTGHEDIVVDVSAPDLIDGAIVLCGDGTGNFPTSFDPLFGYGLTGFGIGDFNHDGLLDLFYFQLGESENSQELQILPNTGHREFGLGSTIDPVDGQSPVAGDFNHDGYSDFAVANGSGIDIYLNGQDGTYTGPLSYAAGMSPNFLFVTDINKDGNRDIIASDAEGKQMVVLLGKGDGTFHLPRLIPVTASPSKFVVGDFNNDGKLDLAVACGKVIEILLGDGEGNFHAYATYSEKAAFTSVAQTSLRRNGIEDIVFTNGASLGILYGKGNGSFEPASYYSVGNQPIEAVPSDFNEDGSPDLVVVDQYSDAITILLNLAGDRIALKSSASTVTVHKPVTLTASVTSTVTEAGTPTGQVTFKSGSTDIGTVEVSDGVAKLNTSSLSEGTHTITAWYAGTSSFNAKVSAGVTVKVVR